MKPPKQPTSFRLSGRARAILDRESARLGLQRVQVMELAVRVLEDVLEEGIDGVMAKLERERQEQEK